MRDTHPGELIAAWLEAEGKRAAWLAREAKLSQAHLSLILARKKGLSAASADRIATITQIDARRLVGLSIPEAAA